MPVNRELPLRYGFVRSAAYVKRLSLEFDMPTVVLQTNG
jgi:hypothetical protein